MHVVSVSLLVGYVLSGAIQTINFTRPRPRRPSVLRSTRGDDDKDTGGLHLVFPGGGIYFYWQAGYVSHLRERGYTFDDALMTGASAGALTATLAVNKVDFYDATDSALELAKQAGVWDRREGLQGIWGPMILEWLDELLPEEPISSSRLSILLTPFPNIFRKEKVSQFQTRKELIEANMASIHLPLFLDSSFTASFRSRQYIDGSFLAQSGDYGL